MMQEISLTERELILLISSNKDSSVLYQMDEGLPFGLGFFETILIRDKPYFVEEHILRLNHSLKNFGFHHFIQPKTVEEFIISNSLKNLALKLIATEKNLLASVRPIPYDSNSYESGKKVTISSIIKSSSSQLVRHKSLNYGENLLELRKALHSSFDDCLFLNENGHVTESALANLFLICDDQLITPPISDGLLPGVIRQKVIENFCVQETSITKEQLKTCQAAFLTNSLYGAMPISQIDSDVKMLRHTLLEEVTRFFGDMLPCSSYQEVPIRD